MEAGVRLPCVALGSLLRTDDPVSAGHRLADPPDSGRVLARLAAPHGHFRDLLVHRWTAAAVRAPVRARLGRFPRLARAAATSHRLVRELGRRDACAQGVQSEPGEGVSDLY